MKYFEQEGFHRLSANEVDPRNQVLCLFLGHQTPFFLSQQSSFRFTAKLGRKYRVPICFILCPPQFPLLMSCIHSCDTFVIIDDPVLILSLTKNYSLQQDSLCCTVLWDLTNAYHVSTIMSSYRVVSLPPKSTVFYPFILPTPRPLVTNDLFIVSIVLPFLEYHILGIMKYVPFSDWLL